MARHYLSGIQRRTSHHCLWATAGAALAWAPAAFAQVAPPVATPPAAVAPVPAPAATPAAVQEVQQDLDGKDWPAAIRAASKLLAVHGDAAGFSRFQVTMLKGDAQLGARAVAAARTTYQMALRETHDPHEMSLAKWTLELLKQSHGTAYAPHVTPGNGVRNAAPIDIVDPDSRKLAFTALLDDQLSLLSRDIKDASTASSLTAILPVARKVSALAPLDEVASGSDARTSAVASGLVEHARTLMAGALKGMWVRISDIQAAATQQVTNSGTTGAVQGQPVTQTTTSQNGLSADNAKELRDMIATCHEIGDAAATFMPLAAAGTDKDWTAIQNDANRVAGRANDVLHANYSGTTTDTSSYPNDGTGVGNGTTIIGTGYGTQYNPYGTTGPNATYPNNTGGAQQPNTPGPAVGATSVTPTTGRQTSGGTTPSGTTAGGTGTGTTTGGDTTPTTPPDDTTTPPDSTGTPRRNQRGSTTPVPRGHSNAPGF